MFLFWGERERESMSGGGQRERHTHNLKQAPGSEQAGRTKVGHTGRGRSIEVHRGGMHGVSEM